GAISSNGAGVVKLGGTETYTGSTAIQNGTLTFLNPGGALPATTSVTFGSATTNGTLDLGGTNQTVAGLAVASGADPTKQIITNSSAANDSLLTVDTSTGSSTFGGIIQNGNHNV